MIRVTNLEYVLAIFATLVLITPGPSDGVRTAWAQTIYVGRGAGGQPPDDGPTEIFETRTIYVPRPKGEGETLDDSARTASGEDLDLVTTIEGDRLSGTVAEMEADGNLRLTGPQFDAEVLVRVSALDQVALAGQAEEPGADEVVLTNQDRLLGELLSLAPDTAVLETRGAGPLRISRKVIRSIHFQKGRSVLLESNFASGRMEPWMARGGSWRIDSGRLVSEGRGSSQFLYAKLDQKEAVTFVVKAEVLSDRYIHCRLVLFASGCDNYHGGNSIFVRFYSSQFYLRFARNNSVNNIVNGNLGKTLLSGTMRLAYDPETGKARLWLDSTNLGEWAVPNKPSNGQYVIFAPEYPTRVQYLQVLRGIVPPAGAEQDNKAEQGDVIHFVNKDRVSVTSVALADGQLTARASYGELRCPVENVESIVFAEKGLEEPRRRKGDVHVETSAGRLTLEFEKLTREYLLGRSDCLGEVKVDRSAIRKIKFNIYRDALRDEVRQRKAAWVEKELADVRGDAERMEAKAEEAALAGDEKLQKIYERFVEADRQRERKLPKKTE